jgi:hypothetical protein
LLVPPGEFKLDTVDLTPPPVMFVGQQAIDGYFHEIGSPMAGADRVSRRGGRDLTPTGLRAMASDGEELLGDQYAAILAIDEQGRKSSTPPPRRHRLVELVTYAREAADEIEGRGEQDVFLDANKLSELMTTVSLFDRWRHHPAWPELVTTLAGRTEGQHTVMLLSVASYLADAGNGIGLALHAHGDGRIPDIWIEPILLKRLEIEVKTPQDLRGPRKTPLTVEEATAILSRRLKKAAASKGGQLDAKQSGILAVGGFHLAPGSLDMLEAAANAVLSRQAGRKTHLAAIAVSEISYLLTEGTDIHGNELQSIHPRLETRIIRHASYSGGLEIRQEPKPAATFSPQPANPPAATPSAGRPPMNRAERRLAERAGRRRRG